MPVYQRLVDFNEVFNCLSEPPIIINDVANGSAEDRDVIRDLIMTRYTDDMVSLLPSCRCGNIKGEFSKGESTVGAKCSVCNSYVKSTFEDNIEPNIWFRKPIGVDKLISPIIWIMLKNKFKKPGFNIIQWLTDRSYNPSVRQPKVLDRIQDSGIKRGYNNFVTEFDSIMAILFSIKEFQTKKGEHDYLQDLLKQNRHLIFSDYIPLPNKTLIIVEKTNLGVYVDTNIVDAIDAIKMLVSIDKNFHDQSQHVKENRTAKALAKLSEFYEKFYRTSLQPKTGQFRRHIFASRTNSSFRAVISSLTDTHEYDEIHVPWGIGLTAFRPHLLNKLMKMGMELNSAIGLLLGHVEKYHPLLDRILQELIQESPNRGIKVILQRNPSLLQGSAQCVRITKFKTDPNDHTIGLSILIVKAPGF